MFNGRARRAYPIGARLIRMSGMRASTSASQTCGSTSLSLLARGRRREPAAGAHRMLAERSARPALARYRRGRHQPSGREDRPARGAARRAEAFLIPLHTQGRGIWILTNCWRTVCADAGLGRLRLHDLRHTASQAVMAGENLSLVGKLLGHRRHPTTTGYAHLADAHLMEAAERVGAVIATSMALHD